MAGFTNTSDELQTLEGENAGKYVPIAGVSRESIKGLTASLSGELLMSTIDFQQTVIEQNKMMIHLLAHIADKQEVEVGEV